MPVYEYQCRSCGTRFSQFYKSSSSATGPVACTACGTPDAQRAISTFQVHQTLKTQLEQLDPRFDKEIDSAMAPHLATDPLNRINLDFDSGVER
jgi:putative FmdB family regulatory protein